VALRNAYDALSDDELVQAVLQREPAAWPTFFAKYERLVISCIRKVMRRYGAAFNEEDLEDLVSATALNIVKDDYKKLRAFDSQTGELLWQTVLPNAGVATPVTYMVNGRQYVVIAAGGGKDPKASSGSVYVAFSLP